MRPPENVKVGPYTYTLKRHDALVDTDRIGETNERHNLIRYSGDLAPMMLRAVILHEVLHACCFAVNLNDTAKLDQEGFISRIEPMLLSVLRDNPDLLGYLLA